MILHKGASWSDPILPTDEINAKICPFISYLKLISLTFSVLCVEKCKR